MFGKRSSKEAPAKPEATSSRYYVETVNLGTALKPEKRATMIQDALNAGDARGWRLVTMEDQGQWHVRIIVWDTKL